MQKDIQALQQIIEDLTALETSQPVLEPKSAETLLEQLPIALGEEGMEDMEVYDLLKNVLAETPRTATRLFFNQLFGGRNPKAVVADMLASFMNNSMYTFKVGGPQILIEKELISQFQSMLGYDGDPGGTMAPGGSMTNFMGMLMARDQAIKDVHNEGVRTKMTMYTSECSHYSLPKNATFMGIGRSQLRYVPADETGAMKTDVLAQMIADDKAAGAHPFMVVATAGTTVMGAFDNIQACADLCQDSGMWLHVDGAYCGSVMFSKKYRHLIDGAHRANSFSINAHKMLSVPLSCSFILVKENKHLYESFANDAEYLYQTDDDDLNPGKISLQCGRRNDALKFWTLWKSIGRSGLEKMVDHHFGLAERARQYVMDHRDYQVYSHANSVNICFNYKDVDPVKLCNALYEEGELMVGYGQFHDDQFVRLVAVNANNEEGDIDYFFKKMEAFAEAHYDELKK